MAPSSITNEKTGEGRLAALFYQRAFRSFVIQALVFLAIIVVLHAIVGNVIANLTRLKIASGYGFLNARAGFQMSESLIDNHMDVTYGRALLAGLVNTIYVSVLCLIVSTVMGFAVGIGRLSHNWIVRFFCTFYVEIFRNIPILLVILFWYFGVMQEALPSVSNSLTLFDTVYVNQRGFYLPKPLWQPGIWLVGAALIVAVIAALALFGWAAERQRQTGRQLPAGRIGLGLLIILPLVAFFIAGQPVQFDVPVRLSAFNVSGGMTITPEFLALFLALSFYTAAYIAETVRAGILGVDSGVREASSALGLKRNQTMRLVIVPLALRIIIPPLASQYMNVVKNTSLAIAIGYPDLVAVGNTTLNQTGQAIEVVVIWMAVYLGLSLCVSAFMNWFNAKMALVER